MTFAVCLGGVIIALSVGTLVWIFELGRRSVDRARREERLQQGFSRKSRP